MDTAVDMPTNDEALFVPIYDIDILNNKKDRTEDAIPRYITENRNSVF